jgi:hypothetical protein
MSSAPLRYRADGSVDWGNMWDSFCELAREGGPPHYWAYHVPDEVKRAMVIEARIQRITGRDRWWFSRG